MARKVTTSGPIASAGRLPSRSHVRWGMRSLACAIVLCFCSPVRAVPRDGWKDATFDRIARGELAGIAFLGFSADGRRYAYVQAEIQDASGNLAIDAVEARVADRGEERAFH